MREEFIHALFLVAWGVGLGLEGQETQATSLVSGYRWPQQTSLPVWKLNARLWGRAGGRWGERPPPRRNHPQVRGQCSALPSSLTCPQRPLPTLQLRNGGGGGLLCGLLAQGRELWGAGGTGFLIEVLG